MKAQYSRENQGWSLYKSIDNGNNISVENRNYY